MNPATISVCLLLLTSVLFGAEGERQAIKVEDLNSRITIIGALGKPIFKVWKVSGHFVKGAPHQHGGNVSLEVTHVDDTKLAKPVRTDFPPWNHSIKLPSGQDLAYTNEQVREALIGKSITCLGYEDVQTYGRPAEILKYVESDADSESKFHSILVIVKVLPEADAKPGDDAKQEGTTTPDSNAKPLR